MGPLSWRRALPSPDENVLAAKLLQALLDVRAGVGGTVAGVAEGACAVRPRAIGTAFTQVNRSPVVSIGYGIFGRSNGLCIDSARDFAGVLDPQSNVALGDESTYRLGQTPVSEAWCTEEGS